MSREIDRFSRLVFLVLKDAGELSEVARLVEGSHGIAFPVPLQNALVCASRGLKIVASMYTDEIEPELGQEAAKQAFEESMLHFYHFSGRVDCNLYFMRLNTRLADELAAGRTLTVTCPSEP